MRSRVSLPVLVLAVLAALLLGSVGSATASGLTVKSVKKIATKVVNKKAKTLSVASAATAGNSTNLAGKPAAAYLDESRVFTTTITTGGLDVVVDLPLTTGAYYVSYHAYLYNGSGASGCYLRKKQGATNVAFLADDLGSSPSPGFSGSGVVSLGAGESVDLYCYSASTFTTLGGPTPDPIQVVVTPLDGVTTTVVAPARPTGTDARP